MITHAASRKQYTVLLDRPEGAALFPAVGAGSGAIFEQEAEKT